MRIETQQVGAVTVIEPKGPVVQDDAQDFADRLKEAVRTSLGRMVLDVSSVPYVDSLGLEAMADVSGQLRDAGLAMRISGANEVLRTVFELTELAGEFDHYEDVNTAVRSFL